VVIVYLLLYGDYSLPYLCFFVLYFVVVFVCLATRGVSQNKGIYRPIKAQEQQEVSKGKQ
jgi:hypothetical protein